MDGTVFGSISDSLCFFAEEHGRKKGGRCNRAFGSRREVLLL